MSAPDNENDSLADGDPVLVTPVIERAESYFRVNEPSVIYQTFDTEVVAVHLNTGSYHTLGGIAGEAFAMFGSAGASPRAVALELAARYDADAASIEEDLKSFLSDLQDQLMVVALDAPPNYRVPAPRAAAEVLLPYTAPKLETFGDLEGLFLIDPVHEVGAAGWPNPASETIEQAASESEAFPRMRCRIAGPNVIFERFNTETVAMDLGTGAYHSLSGAAEEIFLLLPQEPTTWEILSALKKRYGVDAAELESALREYLRQLVQEGLVVLSAMEEDAAEERELDLAGPGGAAFVAPRLETFAQPSFDGSFGEAAAVGDAQGAEREASAEGEEPAAAATYAERRYSVVPGDLLSSAAGGELVISDRDGGKYYKLNEPASLVYRLMAQKPDANEVVAALLGRYSVREPDLRVAVMILLWNLRKAGLVTLVSVEKALDGEETADATATEAAAGQAGGEAAALPKFPGFDVAVHYDLDDLLRPFNYAQVGHPTPKKSSVRQFAQLLEGYYEEAAEASGAVEEDFRIAGQPVKIRCASGGHGAVLLKAFQHLKAAPGELAGLSGLTISAWNNSSVPCGPFLEAPLERIYGNWSAICGPRGEVMEFNTGEITAIFHPGPDVLSVLDRARGHAFYLMRDDAPLPFWELSSPFRHVLHPWFSGLGFQYTHAGAVGGSNGGVLLAGKGGSGKSTTSLLCVSAGMQYAADDYCLTRAEGGKAQVYSLYNTAKLKGPEDLERLPEMGGRSFNPDSFESGGVGKGTFDLSGIWPERMASGFPVRAIVLPTVTGQVDSRLEPCSPADALVALAPSTVAQLPFAGQDDCLRLAALAESAPAYRLYLGSDLSQIPKLIGELAG